MGKFNQFISHIDVDLLRDLCLQQGHPVSIAKNAYFLRAGEVSDCAGYVESGIFRYTTLNHTEQREYNVGLVFPGEFIADYPSCLYGLASEVNIQAVTPCRVYLYPAESLMKRYETGMEGQRMGRVIMEQLFLDVYSRYLDMFRLTPEERYQKLLERCPDLLQQVSLREIASYLGITPTHMSRIRRRLTFYPSCPLDKVRTDAE